MVDTRPPKPEYCQRITSAGSCGRPAAQFRNGKWLCSKCYRRAGVVVLGLALPLLSAALSCSGDSSVIQGPQCAEFPVVYVTLGNDTLGIIELEGC